MIKALPTRFLQQNKPTEYEKLIKFAEEGHHYWLYSKYLDDWAHTKDGCGSATVISTTTILKEYFISPNFTYKAAKEFNNVENKRRMFNDPTYKYYGCRSVQDILAIWGKGAEAGTKMHAVFEDLANLLEHDRQSPDSRFFEQLYHDVSMEGYFEKSYFLQFCEEFGVKEGKFRFERTEFLMAHDVLHLSGMIDGLLYDVENDSYVIVDWKRTKVPLQKDPLKPRKQLHELASSGRGQVLPAFMALRNHSGNTYGCQLTLYKHLFEHMFPEKKISGMFLVVVESTKIGKSGAMVITEVPLNKYDTCIEQVFEARARRILADHGDELPEPLLKELVAFLPPPTPEYEYSDTEE
jgi:hypothetical protein